MTYEINIPFSGFYNSRWENLVNNALEREAEYFGSEKEYEVPEEIRVSEPDIAEMLFNATDFSACFEAIAIDYVESVNDLIWSYCEIDLGLKFKAMESPREYNFTTDRIFSDISRDAIARLFRFSKSLDNHETLEKIIGERFTSYDGFRSFYSNDINAWMEKPLSQWDHNELGTLLCVPLAVISQETGAFDWEIYEMLAEKDFEYLNENVDWPKFENALNEARLELWENLRKTDAPEEIAILWENLPEEIRETLPAPDAPNHVWRCNKTLDLFENA